MLTKIGTLTEIYTDTEYGTGQKCPRLGAVWHDFAAGKAYIFLMNNGATAITAQLLCMALTTDKAAFKCTLAAATASLLPFAGVRVPSATSMAQNEYGWFQVIGSATLSAGASTTTADLGVQSSADTAGKVEVAANTGIGAFGSFGIAQTSTANGDVVVHLQRNVWGVGL